MDLGRFFGGPCRNINFDKPKFQRRHMTKIKNKNIINFIINDFIFNNTRAKADIS